jgi:hypothetical protein
LFSLKEWLAIKQLPYIHKIRTHCLYARKYSEILNELSII